MDGWLQERPGYLPDTYLVCKGCHNPAFDFSQLSNHLAGLIGFDPLRTALLRANFYQRSIFQQPREILIGLLAESPLS